MKDEELLIEGKTADEFAQDNGWVDIDGWLVDSEHADEFREQQKLMSGMRSNLKR